MPALNLQRRYPTLLRDIHFHPAPAPSAVSSMPWSSRYIVALAVTAVTTLTHLFVADAVARSPFLVYTFAVVISGIYGGFGPGLVATGLSSIACLAVATSHVPINDPGLNVPAAVFMAVGVAISYVSHNLHRSVRLLRSNEQRFRSIVEGVRDYAVFMLDAEGAIATWNLGAARIKRYSAKEILGKHFDLFYPPEERALGKPQKLLALAAEKGSVEDEGWRLRKDGTRFWASVVITAIRDEMGFVVGYSKIVRDLTERRRADEAARERYLRAIIDAQPALVAYIDRDLRYVFNNRTYEAWFGVAPEAIKGKHVKEVIGASAYEKLKPRIVEALSGKVVSYEEELDSPSSGRRWVHGHYAPHMDAVGNVTGFFVFVTDITDRKSVENELERIVGERTAKLEETVAELEAFSYTVSHDLRAPLRAIQGYAHFLAETEKGLGMESARLLGRIADSATRMDRLIQDLLAFGRLSREDYKMYPVALQPIVDHVLEQYPALAAAQVDLNKPLGRVIGQDSLLTQALSNLLVNAAKFVPPEQTPHIELRAERSGDRVRLVVEDHGIGIPKEQLPKLFTPFQRLHTGYEGTGIGLAIVKKAVERMGGTVGVESREGNGSRFWLELPAAD
ncbi:MAG: PAS domain S-box protein [Elusimicrobia bacterium]|nr:PAS domain S-box protein [Elusimicrobiota bacterium]